MYDVVAMEDRVVKDTADCCHPRADVTSAARYASFFAVKSIKCGGVSGQCANAPKDQRK